MRVYLVRLYELLHHLVRRHLPLLLLLLLGVVAPWFVFVEVAEDIWESGGFIGDQAILRWVHAHGSPALDRLAVGLTTVGGPMPMLSKPGRSCAGGC